MSVVVEQAPRRWRRLTPRRVVVGTIKSVFKLSTAVVVMVLVGLVAGTTALVTYVFLPLPVDLPEERLQPERQASTVFALDGTPIGVFKGAETQTEIAAENIPDTIRRAVVSPRTTGSSSTGASTGRRSVGRCTRTSRPATSPRAARPSPSS
jgi:hypothetical protein